MRRMFRKERGRTRKIIDGDITFYLFIFSMHVNFLSFVRTFKKNYEKNVYLECFLG